MMKQRLIALALLLCLLLSGCSVEGVPPAAETTAGETQAGEQQLLVHFLDVGQADCALLEYEGKYMLIDGGNREDSQLVVTYLENQGVQELEAVVCSHAHEDHVGGLPAVLAVFPTKAVYAPTNDYASKVFDEFLYYTDQQGLSVTIPRPGDTLTLGGVELLILGPVKTYPDANNTSIVLKATYGNTSFLFTGDMEKEAENDMLDHWEDSQGIFRSDVLKVGHHGSDTSSGYRFLNEVAPTYGVISVGKGNSYGHPHKEPLERFAQAEITLLRTDNLGAVVAHSDGNTVSFTWENQSSQPDNAEPAEQERYIGNRNSRKFHSTDCSGLPAQKNQVIFETYQEALDSGFTPCGSCLG